MSAFLGGLLSGIGQGMEKQALYNREQALENLRNQRQIEQENRANTRVIAQEGRKEEADNRAAERDHGYKVNTLKVAGDITENQAQSEYGRKVSFAQIQSSLNIKEGRASEQERRATIQMQDDLNSGKATQFVVDANGEYVGLTANGGKIAYGIKAKPEKETASDRKAQMEIDDANRKRARALAKKNLGVWKKGMGEIKAGMTYRGQMFLGGDGNDRNNWVVPE